MWRCLLTRFPGIVRNVWPSRRKAGGLQRKVDNRPESRQRGKMEEHLIDAATAELLVKIAWYAAAAVISGGVAMIGTLLWGKGGRKRLIENNKCLNKRIAALEAQYRAPAIQQTINFHSDVDIKKHERQLREAVESETADNLKQTIRSLPQMPLGDGHTYACLPDGTNIVSMADGTMRLALPVNVSVSISSGVPTVSASLTTEPVKTNNRLSEKGS